MIIILKLKNITKSYKTKNYIQKALDKVSISFRKNEFAAILGPSGSGKSTMLNIIGGLDRYDSGDLLIDGISTKEYKSSNWDNYRNTRVGFVFQSFNLISHQNILSNVELSLTLSGISKKERKDRAIRALDNVGLIDHIYKLPNQISGGQMQRVAIARALINNPEILLADEPTGSLDSNTSKQVMELLKEIAKDRLVIMVTHNPKLANKYANRIIELKDGQIIGDTNPYNIHSGEVEISKDIPTKSRMSLLTAISLSISNLRTKKGRTIITAIAGSIGIIGIAAILSLASGINLYIKNIEKDTMSAYPLTVDSSGIDITSFLNREENPFANREKKEKEEDEINVIDTFSSLLAQQNKNDLKSFKTYIEENKDEINPYVKNIKYKYGIVPQIYLKDEKSNIRQVNPDTIFSEAGFDSPGGFDMISGASNFGMKNFSELPGHSSLLKEQYDIVKGRLPKEKDELVVVLTSSGSLTDTTMYTLGLKDRNKLKKIFEGFTNDEKISVEDDKLDKVFYEDILKTSFKLINPAEKYVYDKTYNIWVDKSEDEEYMNNLIENGLDLNVVGIIKVKPEVKTPMLSTGIYYSDKLIENLIKEASSYDIVKSQLENKDINVFTKKRFDKENEFNPEGLFKLGDIIKIDQNMIKKSFNFDSSVLNMDILDFNISLEDIEFPSLDLNTLMENIGRQIDTSIPDIESILLPIIEDFIKIQEEKGVEEIEEWVGNFDQYIRSEETRNRLTNGFEEINRDIQMSQNISEIVQNYFSSYINTTFNQIMETVKNDFSRQIRTKMPQLASNIQRGISIDRDLLSKAFQFNIEEDELFDLISSLRGKEQLNQNANLKLLGYRDLENPTQIDLYPKDFTTKEGVVEFIDNYNEKMKNINQEDKVVKYTDLIGALLSSVTTIINTITYALIAFVAISLVVSSIMIGVITYVSVLERVKEIGIIRSIGGSKKDIRRVFNAETLIIGFIAGVFGILITYIMGYFANIVVYNKFGIPNISYLETESAAILIGISMILAFISGLIPASTAANKNPVEALRTE